MAPQNLVFRGTHQVKTVMMQVLRAIFSDPVLVKDDRYRYSTKQDDTKIKIYRAYPKEVELYPTIVISVGSHDAGLVTLDMGGKEVASERIDNGILVSQTATGYTKIPLVMKVIARGSSDDRENLSDLLVMALRILGRSKFFPFGFTKIRVGEEGQFTDRSTEMVFTNTVTVEAHTDYTLVTGIDEDGLIDKILVNVLMVNEFST